MKNSERLGRQAGPGTRHFPYTSFKRRKAPPLVSITVLVFTVSYLKTEHLYQQSSTEFMFYTFLK